MAFLGINLQMKQGDAALLRWGLVSTTDIYEGRWWGLISNAFTHIEPLHLFFNMYWLWFFGAAFEKTFGAGRLIAFVLVSAFITSGLQLLSGNGGIGFSGVGYALFGFGWATRKRYPEMARVATPRTVQMFLIWGVICVIATQAKVMNIGNIAHGSGALLGYLFGYAIITPRWRYAALAGIIILAAGSAFSLSYNPLSEDWLAVKAGTHMKRREFAKALPYLYEYTKRGSDMIWAWSNIAYAENALGHDDLADSAVEQRRIYDPEPGPDIGSPANEDWADTR